jgi:hypothetical protein
MRVMAIMTGVNTANSAPGQHTAARSAHVVGGKAVARELEIPWVQ